MTGKEIASTVSVLGTRIHCLSTRDVLGLLNGFLHARKARSVYIVNAHTANLAYLDPEYRSCLNRGDLVLNDGTGVRWAARMRGVKLTDNHVGTDLIPLLCDQCQNWGIRVFLLGGKSGVAARAADTLLTRFPGLNIAGHRHGYFQEDEEADICSEINRTTPHLVLVAMGNPLQELWIDRNLKRLKGPVVVVGVGGLIDHLAGNLKRAPRWIRRAGIEWTQILLQQPHKWRRYLLGNPLFLYRMVRNRPLLRLK